MFKIIQEWVPCRHGGRNIRVHKFVAEIAGVTHGVTLREDQADQALSANQALLEMGELFNRLNMQRLQRKQHNGW